MFNSKELEKNMEYNAELKIVSIRNFSLSVEALQWIGKGSMGVKLELIDCVFRFENSDANFSKFKAAWSTIIHLKNIKIQYERIQLDFKFIYHLFYALKKDKNILHLEIVSDKIYKIKNSLFLENLLIKNSTLLTISAKSFNFTEEALSKIEKAIAYNSSIQKLHIAVEAATKAKNSHSFALNELYQGTDPLCLTIVDKMWCNGSAFFYKDYMKEINKEPNLGTPTLLLLILKSQYISQDEKHQAFLQSYLKFFKKGLSFWQRSNSFCHELGAVICCLLSFGRNELYEQLNLDRFHQEFMSPTDAIRCIEAEININDSSIPKFLHEKSIFLARIKAVGLPLHRVASDVPYALKLLSKLFDDLEFTLPLTKDYLDMIRLLIADPLTDNVNKGRLYEKLALGEYSFITKQAPEQKALAAINSFHIALDLGNLRAKDSFNAFYHRLATEFDWNDFPLEIIRQAISDGFHEFKLILAHKLSLVEGANMDQLVRASIVEGIKAIHERQTSHNQAEIRRCSQLLRKWFECICGVADKKRFYPIMNQMLPLLQEIEGCLLDKEEFYNKNITSIWMLWLALITTSLNSKEKYLIVFSLAEYVLDFFILNENRFKTTDIRLASAILPRMAYQKFGAERERIILCYLNAFQTKQQNPRIKLFLDDSDRLTFKADARQRDRSLTSLLATICLVDKEPCRLIDLEKILRLICPVALDHFVCLALNNDPQGRRVLNILERYAEKISDIALQSHHASEFKESLELFYCYLGIHALVLGKSFSDFHNSASKRVNIISFLKIFVNLLVACDATFISPVFLEIVCEKIIFSVESGDFPLIATTEEYKNIKLYKEYKLQVFDEETMKEDSQALASYLDSLAKPDAASAPPPGTITSLNIIGQPLPSAPPGGTQTLAHFHKKQENKPFRDERSGIHSPIILHTQLNLHDRIAQGGQGDIYRANWDGMEVAVKSLREFSEDISNSERLFSECQILSRLRHPSIVTFYGYTDPRERGQFCMVMEYYKRGSLSNYIYDPQQWNNPLLWRLRCTAEVSQGMMYLHEQNILHLDIKAANVFVDSSWHCKLGDFGISKTLQTMQSQQTTLNLNGTPSHMAPELISHNQGAVQHTPMNDVYSFGVFLWANIAERKPFDNWTPFQIMFQVVQNAQRPEIPDFTPTKIADLIRLCWCQQPDQRPNAKIINAQLQEVLKSEEALDAQELYPTKKAI